MRHRTVTFMKLCATLVAAAAFISTAQAGNVAWGVSVGGPGFNVSAGQPGYFGVHGYRGAPYRPIARSHYRPYFPLAYRAAVVVPPVAYPYYAPALVVYAPRPAHFAPRGVIHAQRPFTYPYAGYGPTPMQSAPSVGSY